MNPTTGLLIALGIATVYYLVIAAQGVLRQRGRDWRPGGIAIGTGALTAFLDTLGIGSFAPTTAIFRATRRVPDEQIPGTLNIGHALATALQGFLFLGAVTVDPTTLIAMIVAASAGAWFGAGVVAGWPRRAIQIGMGIALLCSAALFVARNLGLIHIGGTADGVSGWLLVVGVLVNMALGAFMTIGIGLYAPCMILVSLLGMNERAAFPIMMGSCAFLQIAASRPFILK
ncbi:MAG: permease, partial [Gammaproteobacteria bacterium]